MQYMLLIYDDEAVWGAFSEEERNRIFAEYGQYTEELRASGAFVSGAALQPTATATTVTEEGGKRIVTDGPFAETKEQLGGYYLVDVESMDEALDWAGRIPSVRAGGRIEVRPLLPVGAPAS